MYSLYETIETLCKVKGINISTMCKESGASRGSLTDLKMGRKQQLSTETLSKISAHFGVSVDYLLGQESFRYDPTSELLRLRELLGSDYQLRVITNITCVCKELPNGYILVVDCHKLSEDNFCDATIEVWNYASQPFVKRSVFCRANIEILKSQLLGLENEYKNKPQLENRKKKPAANSDEPDITFDDFTYALHNETKELTEENKQKLLEMAKFFKTMQDKEKSE
ncbi:MAG: helix-turn-helix transcriptional regulator [Oscillospiraceae bacterium]|jgi:transcriptional regulator with XRE-family HTH domain|nr:helix-turn-helix transcriptional regulator [Oscillospiraceae bacterium]